MEHLITKYIHNDLSPTEAAELKAWLENDVSNRKLFENMVGAWKLREEELDEIRQRVLNNIKKGNQTRQTVIENPPWGQYLFRVAAVLLIGFIMTITVYKFTTDGSDSQSATDQVFIEKVASFGQKLTVELPDGSIVKLNSGSSLVYPENFTDEARNVTLFGEAFFDVMRDESRPFKVKTGAIDVQVLGTSFNVKYYPTDPTISVAVKSGKVAVSNAANVEEIILSPEEMLTYNMSEQSFVTAKISNEDLLFGWKDLDLIFEDHAIEEILKILSRWYDVEFELDKELDNEKKFTARYKNPILSSVMESLAYAYDFEYEIKEKKVIIK